MGKQEIKQELELFKKINEALTSKLCFLLLGNDKYVEARVSEGVDGNIIQKEIDLFKEELKHTKEALLIHYFGDDDNTG